VTATPRARFSVRIGQDQELDLAPYDEVPAHLELPLVDWIGQRLTGDYGQRVARDICLGLRLNRHSAGYVTTLQAERGYALLDVVDRLLAYQDPDGDSPVDESDVEELGAMLDAAGSAYRVEDSADGLEVRVVPGVREAASSTIAEAKDQPDAGSAGEHLTNAWQAAYGLHPDPVGAYSEAIKAVEAAAHHVVQDNHPKPTLGTMLGEIPNARHKFVAVIHASPKSDPVAMVEAMMRTLWEGQTSRHGGKTPTVPETLEAARAAVHLAVTLVQWFTSDAVSRT
jgi:hypothetical protein